MFKEVKRTKRYKCKTSKRIMKITLIFLSGFLLWQVLHLECNRHQEMHENAQNGAKNNIEGVGK